MERKMKQKSEEEMPNLPEEILLEIFVNLPVRSLARFKCVSKSLYRLIASSCLTSIIFASKQSQTMYSIDYNSVMHLSTSSTAYECDDFINQMHYPNIPNGFVEDFLCSCEGWLCVRCYFSHEKRLYLYLWNPLTQKYKAIPSAHERFRKLGWVYGLGYDAKIDKYKLVRIHSSKLTTGSGYSPVAVYTLGSDSWRPIARVPYTFASCTPNNGVLLNGSIYWLACTIGEQRTRVVVSFDIVNETFHEVALPEEPIQGPIGCLDVDINLGALGGSLCLILNVFKIQIDVWVMQNYIVSRSWTKIFTISEENITHNPYVKLLWRLKHDEILLETGEGFILYDPKSERYRKMLSNKFKKENFAAGQYGGNLVSLK